MKRALVSGLVTRLYRKNKRTGNRETVHYLGSLRLKPKGWRVDKFIGAQ